MNLKNIFCAFHVIFYPGSWVPKQFYDPFLQEFSQQVKTESLQIRTNPFAPFDPKNDTILIGHSFGGYKALNDYLKNPTNISRIILISSHTNYGKKAPYPSIDERQIKVPTLIHCGTNDKRLLFSNVVHDYWKRKESHSHFYTQYFMLENGTHFQPFEKPTLNLTVSHISNFLDNQKSIENMERFDYDPNLRLPFFYNIDHIMGIVDYLMSLLVPRFHWQWLHHMYFLQSCSTIFSNFGNTDFTDSILIKSTKIDPFLIEKEYKKLFLTQKPELHCKKLSPTVFGLYYWLLAKPKVKKKNDTVIVEYFQLSLPKDRNYYKIPSPKRYLTKLFFS